MNWSAEDVAEVPGGVITVTSTVPVPAGLSAVIVVSLTTVRFVAGRRAEVDRRGAGETRAGDRHRSAAGHRTAGRAQAGDRRRGGRGVGELVGGRGGRGAGGSRHGDVQCRAGARRAVGGDRVSLTTVEIRRRPSCRSRRPWRR